jgi:glycosyltransferase involved in cell wall biosynthesis
VTISVLVPSRERPELLKRSVESLGEGDFEVLVALDEDDPRLADYAGIGIMCVGPRHGYRSLQGYYNQLASRATGDWLMVWNDDCMMQTANWIEVVRSHDGEMVVLNPSTNHDNWKIDMNVFPIFPRKIVELTGHVSLSRHNDSWIEFVARDAGIMVRVPIVIHHDRADLTGNNDDAVYAERRLDHEGFHSEELERARGRDVQAILAYIARNGRACPLNVDSGDLE